MLMLLLDGRNISRTDGWRIGGGHIASLIPGIRGKRAVVRLSPERPALMMPEIGCGGSSEVDMRLRPSGV